MVNASLPFSISCYFRCQVCVLVLCTGICVILGAVAAPKTMLEYQVTGGYVEHQVDVEQARSAARTLEPELYVGRPGCAECTSQEIEYCSGSAVLYDHCCCDMRHFETFPYIPHTCYLRPDCWPLAGDCARYTRLRVCCCEHITALKWKSEASLSRLSWKSLLLCSAAVFLVL